MTDRNMIRQWIGGLGLSLLLGCSAVAESNHFYFVQIADTHIGSLDHASRLERIVASINALPFPIECVLHSGDIGADNLLRPDIVEQTLTIMGRLRAPVYYVPGNHDIMFRKPSATMAVYTNRFGPLCTSVECHGVVFVTLHTDPLRRRVTAGAFDPLSELERMLAGTAGKPVIMVQHHPPVDDFFDNRVRAGWDPDIRNRWARIIRTGNVKAVITGHFHRDELHWIEGVPIFVCAPVAGYWGRQGSFRIYEYDHGRLGYRTVYLEKSRRATEPSARRPSP